MIVRNGLLIVLLITGLCTVVAKKTNEHSVDIAKKTTDNPCENHEDFPIFGGTLCASRTLCTVLLLSSVILAGISFLTFVICLLVFYFRRRVPSDVNPDNNNNKQSSTPETSITDDDSTTAILPTTKTDQHISNVLKNIIDTVGRNKSSHILRNSHNFIIPTRPTYSSFNSFKDLHPIPDLPIGRQLPSTKRIPKLVDAYELPTRESANLYSSIPRQSVNIHQLTNKVSSKL